MFRIEVSRMCGETVPFDVDLNGTVEDIHDEIERVWRLPRRCQRLLLGGALLDDASQGVAALCDGEFAATIAVTLLVHFGEICQEIESGRRIDKFAALRTIAAVGPHGGDVARDLVLECFQDSAFTLRKVAVETLGMIADRGDIVAIAATVKSLKDSDWWVRKAATETLVQLVFKGDQEAIAALRGAFADWHGSVRAAALLAVTDLTGMGDTTAIAVVKEGLTDQHWTVRKAAVEALARVFEVTSEDFKVALRAHIRDTDRDVRVAAAEALVSAAQGGDPRSVVALCRLRLWDRDPGVRAAAASSLRRVRPLRRTARLAISKLGLCCLCLGCTGRESKTRVYHQPLTLQGVQQPAGL